MLRSKNIRFDLQKQERKILFIFLLGVVFYASLILLVDLRKIVKISMTFNWSIIPILLALTLINYLFRYLRWHYFLRQISIKIPIFKSLRIFLAGLSMTVTPGKMGEVVKAYLVKKETGKNYAQIVPILIIERVTDGIGMLILALGGIYLFRQSLIFFLFSLAIVLLFFLFIYYKKFTLNLIRKFENKTGHLKPLDFFITFFDHSEKLLKVRHLSIATLLSLLAWFLEGYSLFLLLNSLGVYWYWEAFFYSLFIFSFSSIAGFLAFLPGGIGVAEGSISSLSTLLFKLTLPQAIFLTLIFRFVTLWFGVLIGLINLIFSFSKLRKL